MQTVLVDAEALRKVLQALIGEPHEIRVLQVISDLPGYECPIKQLVWDYNKAVEEHNKTSTTTTDSKG